MWVARHANPVRTMSALGIDLGTSAVKAVIVSASGELIDSAGATYDITSFRPRYAETDPRAWISAVRASLEQLKDSLATVEAIGLSGQMHSVVLTDANGEPVAPAVLWPDGRATAEAAEINTLPEELIGSLSNRVHPGMAAATLKWFERHEPDVLGRARWALQPKDWLWMQLTGVAETEPSDASATGLFDVARRRWHAPLIQHLGIPAYLLPPVARSARTAQVVTSQAASTFCLPRQVPIAHGAADVAASLVGSSTVPGELLLIMGTGVQVVVPLTRPTPEPTLRTHLFCGAAPGEWYRMAAVQNAGLALNWCRQLLGMTWADFYEQVSPSPGPTTGPVFLPHLTGERTPFHNPDLRAGWVNLALAHTTHDLVQAAAEGVAATCRVALDQLPEAADSPTMTMVGGGSSSESFVRLLATYLERPLTRINTKHVSALGAACLARAAHRDRYQQAHQAREEPITPL
jgi:xylulokinase